MNGKKWEIWGISEIGPLHIKENLPNQDSYIVKKYSWGVVGVVCDGLGSKKYSEIGSNALVEALIEIAKKFDFSKDINLFESLLKQSWDRKIHPYSQNETSTTLLFIIIKYGKIYIGRVGDGAIGIFGKNNFIIEENKGTFTNCTIPFGREEKINWSTFDEDDINYAVICSDGISEDISKEKLMDFLKNILNIIKENLLEKEVEK